jgi:hypothetical protein
MANRKRKPTIRAHQAEPLAADLDGPPVSLITVNADGTSETVRTGPPLVLTPELLRPWIAVALAWLERPPEGHNQPLADSPVQPPQPEARAKKRRA